MEDRNDLQIPKHFKWAHIDAPELGSRVSLRTKHSIRDVASAVIGWSGGATAVLFQGPTGTGKTSFAVACLRAVVPAGALFIAAHELDRVNIAHPAGKGRPPLLERALVAPLVLIDGMGQDRFSLSAVASVICERHDAELPTWVTTDLDFDGVAARYGEVVQRRLFEKGIALVIGFGRTSER